MHGFGQVCHVLDSDIWWLRGQGLGAKVKNAEPLTSDDEDVLWQKGALVQATFRRSNNHAHSSELLL